MMAFAIIALFLAIGVDATPREAVVVPVGPKNRTEAERQKDKQNSAPEHERQDMLVGALEGFLEDLPSS